VQKSSTRRLFAKLTEKKIVLNVGKVDGVGVIANARGSTPTKLVTNFVAQFRTTLAGEQI